MAAVLVGAAAYLNPEAFGIAARITPTFGPSIVSILPVSRVEMGLGVAIGAITFSGSVIAFLKLNGNMHFGTARAVKGAALEDLERAPGISKATARQVYDYFHPRG